MSSNDVEPNSPDDPRASGMAFGSGTVFLATIAIVVQLIDAVAYHGNPALNLYFTVVTTVVVIRLAIGTFARRDAAFRNFRGWKSATITLLITSIVVSVLFGGGMSDCPHGRVIIAGPVGIAISSVGGPCRNQRPGRIAWHIHRDLYFVID